jgi:thiol-disulfide isomerase/thioredoxin
MIAPTFESLSTKYAKPGKITFCKVNVDNHQSIAQSHGVSAMPTFLIFKSGAVVDTIRGASPPALTAAVEKAVKLAAVSPPGASFVTPGRTLGAGGSGNAATAPARSTRGNTLGGRPSWSFSPFNFINTLLTFFGLYFVSLLSVCPHAFPPPFRAPLMLVLQFDPYKAAERSDLNLNRPRTPPAPIKVKAHGSAGGPSASGRAGGVRTLADLGGS